MPNIKKQCDTKFYRGPHSVTTCNKLKFEIFGLLSFKFIIDINNLTIPVFNQKSGPSSGPVLK